MTAALPTGVQYLAASHVIRVTAAPGTTVTLNGYDFSVNGEFGVEVIGASNGGGGNVVIKNCNFAVGSNNIEPIGCAPDAGPLTLEYCVIDGGGANNGVSWSNSVGTLVTPGNGGLTMMYCYMKNAMEDGVDPNAGPIVIKSNLFDAASFNTLAHADWVQLNNDTGGNSLDFEFNTVVQPAGTPDNLNSMTRINMEVTSCVVAYNTAINQTPEDTPGATNNWIQMVEATSDAPSKVLNPSIHDNYFTIDPDQGHPWIYPIDSSYPGGIVNPNVYNNINLATGQVFLLPPPPAHRMRH